MAEDKTVAEAIKSEAEKAATEAIEAVGGDKETIKKWVQALIFGVPVGTVTVGWLSVYPEKSAYVCLILGAMAIAIAVQQFYLFQASNNTQAKRAYLWGTAALIFLGSSSMLSSLGTGIIDSQFSSQRLTSITLPLLYMGLVCLYRFVILYLYTGVNTDILYHNPITIFSSKAMISRTFDLVLSISAAGLLALALLMPELFKHDHELLPKFLVSVHFRMNPFSAVTGLIFLLSTYAMSLAHFVLRFKSLNETDVICSTLSFFQCMIKAFYFSTVAQALFLFINYFDVNAPDEVASTDKAAIVALILLGLTYIFIPLVLGVVLKDRFKKKICYSMAPVMVPVGIWCVWSGNIFGEIPMPYITLGLLTLGFAYLPANDLINLRRASQ